MRWTVFRKMDPCCHSHLCLLDAGTRRTVDKQLTDTPDRQTDERHPGQTGKRHFGKTGR